jgi:hypothetical protein
MYLYTNRTTWYPIIFLECYGKCSCNTGEQNSTVRMNVVWTIYWKELLGKTNPKQADQIIFDSSSWISLFKVHVSIGTSLANCVSLFHDRTADVNITVTVLSICFCEDQYELRNSRLSTSVFSTFPSVVPQSYQLVPKYCVCDFVPGFLTKHLQLQSTVTEPQEAGTWSSYFNGYRSLARE